MHKRKNVPIFGFKALIDEGPGVFEAVVSVFGNVDLIGDRVLAGSFAKSLARWSESGDPIPVIFSHQWDNLDAHVGVVLEAKELLPGAPELVGTPIADLGGLWIKARLDVEDPEETFARRLWKRLEARRIKEFSFAYDVIVERRASDGANDLVELDVIEVGPTLKGMNPATELLAAKALGAELTPAHTTYVGEVAENLRAIGEPELAASLAKSFGLELPERAAKAVVELAGSVEERQSRILAAGFDAVPVGEANGGFYDLALEGTFPDRVVFRLEGWDDPVGGGRYFEVPIEAEDPELVLGEAVEVVVEGVTRPKARLARSAKGLVDVATVTAGEKTGKPEDKVEDPEGGKAEDPTTRTGTGSSTGEAARLLLELDDLELSS